MFIPAIGLWRNSGGAVAPTIALSLVGLIAAGGIAFDYARLASMDSELQGAADQAALAAASQLDGQPNACARAAAAASSLLANDSLFANDGGGKAIEIPTVGVADCNGNAAIQFFQSYDQATDTPGAAATGDNNARIVIVSITPRQAVYALTPIVGMLNSGDINAQAIASVGSAICKMPPLMICNPQETTNNTDFNVGGYIGKGLRLTSVGNGSGGWVPGNFGYLDTGGGSNGAQGLREALGWDAPPGECTEYTGVDTKPGANVAVTDATNTRFDIYDGTVSCPSGGACPASINSLKDVRRAANANGGNSCKFHNQGWRFDTSGSGYYGQTVPTSTVDLPVATVPSAMGHPRDKCHAISIAGTCADGRIGNGAWDRDAYFRTNYVRSVASAGGAAGTRWTSAQWKTNTGLSDTVAVTAPNYASRYNVYAWEIENRDTLVDGVIVLGQRTVGATGNQLVSYGKPQCSGPQGYGTGTVPDDTVPDRRRVSVAVVNCVANGVRGNSVGVPVEKWIDVFLVEPSLNRARTNAGDLYVEVITEALAGGSGATAGQVIRRDLPYLIK